MKRIIGKTFKNKRIEYYVEKKNPSRPIHRRVDVHPRVREILRAHALPDDVDGRGFPMPITWVKFASKEKVGVETTEDCLRSPAGTTGMYASRLTECVSHEEGGGGEGSGGDDSQMGPYQFSIRNASSGCD